MTDWYQIENNHFIVQLNSTGAEIKRFFAKPWHRELLWVPSDEITRSIWNRSAPLLFPIVGKLKDDQYHLKGKTYKMAQHGFARDWTFKCLECGVSEITFKCEADQETFKQYPFCFELLVKYTLVDRMLNIDYMVKNVDRQDMYFSIGAHPALATPDISHYEIRFEKNEDAFFHLADKLVNWKRPTAMTSKVVIPTKELFAQDALIFKDVKSKYVDLINHKSHETIRVHGTNTPYLGIWGKGELPFLCIEPWYGVSDDEAHDQNFETKRGIQTLAMGAVFQFSYSLEILV